MNRRRLVIRETVVGDWWSGDGPLEDVGDDDPS
jgi:hypothetical protein